MRGEDGGDEDGVTRVDRKAESIRGLAVGVD